MEKIIEFLEEKKFLVIGGFILVFVLLQIFLFCYFNNKIEEKISLFNVDEEVLVMEEEKVEEVVVDVPQIFYVDIKGEVKKPGTYKVEEGKRVIDVITLAGGVTTNADTSVNNLSLKVSDEMVIIIYSKEEVRNWISVKEEEVLKEESCKNNDNEIKNDSCIIIDEESTKEEDLEETKLININIATKEELMTLSGVGESKALSIIEYREKNGLFNSIEDIKNVSGIGDSLYEQIKNYITT